MSAEETLLVQNICELYSTYFCGVYANAIYERAQEHLSQGTHKSLTEAYIACARAYVHAFNDIDERGYRAIVRGLQAYCNGYLSTPYETVVDFLNACVAVFVPSREYYESMTPAHRSITFKAALKKINEGIFSYVVSKVGLRALIDERNEVGKKKIRTYISEIIPEARESLIKDFFRGDDPPSSDSNSGAVPVEIYRMTTEKMKSMSADLTKSRREAARFRDEIVSMKKKIKYMYEQLKKRDIALNAFKSKLPSLLRRGATPEPKIEATRIDTKQDNRPLDPHPEREEAPKHFEEAPAPVSEDSEEEEEFSIPQINISSHEE